MSDQESSTGEKRSTEERWTVGKLLDWTAKFLKERGSQSPRLDAEVLLAHARGCRRIDLYTAFETEPTAQQRDVFRELVRRRSEGTPVAYLVGYREFYSLSFRVTPDVLIPRPETELLVVRLIDLAKAGGAQQLQIADIGTGSGVLAVCAAKQLPQARVLAVDISAKALQIARDNAARHGVQDRIEFVCGDLFAAVDAQMQFDFVVSNPPYVRSSEFAALSADVSRHEPRHALEAGPLGTEVIAPLIDQSAARLKPAGYLLFEISPMLRDAVDALLDRDVWDQVQFVKDHAGMVRVVQARRRGDSPPLPPVS